MDKDMANRLWKLLAMVVCGFSLVWLIPESGVFRASRLIAELPDELLNRASVDLKISSKERATLAKDTIFARKRYYYDQQFSDPYVDVSVVFSGKDINNSIHRPEICLRAQGWTLQSERYVVLESGGVSIPYKEILSSRPRVSTDGMAYKNSKGEIIVDQRLLYYTFVGADSIVAGHYERTWEDIKCRVLKGADQQWAYVTISMDVTKNPLNDMQKQSYFKELDVEQTRVVLEGFVSEAMPLLLKN